MSNPGTHYIDVCCISKPEFWGQHVMFEAMVHLGYSIAPYLKEMGCDSLPIRYNTHKQNAASQNLGKAMNHKLLCDLDNHFNGPRFRWEMPLSNFLNKGEKAMLSQVKSIYDKVYGLKELNFKNVIIVPKEVLNNDNPSVNKQNSFLEVIESPKQLTSSKSSVFIIKITEEAQKGTKGPFFVYVSVHSLSGVVVLYKKTLIVPCLRQYIEPEQNEVICEFQLRMADNPGVEKAIICCQLFHKDKFVAQVASPTKLPKKRKSRVNTHADICLVAGEYLSKIEHLDSKDNIELCKGV